MFDLAALPMPALPLATGGIALENAGNAGESGETALTGGFEALLAIQTAQPVAATLNVLPGAADPATLPASGKNLPDAALPVAALGFAIAADDLVPAPAAPIDERVDRGENTATDEAQPEQSLPDPTLIAAIFAAPQRPATRTPVAEVTSAPQKTVESVKSTIRQTPLTNAEPGLFALATTVSVARGAVIETDPAVPETVKGMGAEEAAGSQAAPAMAASPRPARPLPAARVASEKSDAPSAPVPTLAADVADDSETSAPIETADDLIATVQPRSAEPSPRTDTTPTGRTEIRPERIDFATLVETLNRAREEAEPTTFRVAVAHADFGRVSMRFDQDDKGMTVAMSSADPGFARAVSATNEAASTNASADTPRDQAAQSQSRNAGTTGDGARQQHQHDTRTPTAQRPAAQVRDTLRRNADREAPGGIFA